VNRATAGLVLSDPGRSISYVLLSGLAWGIVVTTFESLSQPPLELSLPDYLMFYSRILLHYGAGGLLLAWLTAHASNLDRRIARSVAIPGLLSAAMAVALLIDRLSIRYVPFWSNDAMAMVAPLPDVAAHLAWNFSVYGGLYVLAIYFLQNETLTRERLRLTELARVGAEDRMERAITEDRSPLVAPELLLRALSELARRYDENHRRANALLDKLVRLLRSASGVTANSCVGREADLTVSLGQLRTELGLSEQDSLPDGAKIPPQEADHEHVGSQ
jgi:hypothetical protein